MRPFSWILVTTTCLAGLTGTPALANPTGGIVSAGSASIASSGSTLTVTQSSDKAVIDWRSFNIAPTETTDFAQPSTSAIALNRVGDVNPSVIEGQLDANGHVMIINPNGVLFTKSAQVDVGGITATTANITNSDFMAGNFNFSQPGSPSASVVNQGNITVVQAGLASFVAPQVENDGVITARLGKINLASGDTFTLDLAGDGKLQVVVPASQLPMQSITNTGTLAADGGAVTLSAAAASGIVHSLIVNTGVIQANSLQNAAGAVTLSATVVENTGSLTATGGQVTVNATNIAQQGRLTADAIAETFSGAYIDNAASQTTANTISITGAAGSSLFASGGYTSPGGNIGMAAETMWLYAAALDASGTNGGGSIFLGDA
ncbi:MAG TPA: filamentous hemagglutinin N-terminal domain-containing protein, partial [Candidatus Saccharimonadales bacterium]|nr:filamentous hemagglutinin N-terminal domain-containing protein [Candidatus Saccharimonadales bacterium]